MDKHRPIGVSGIMRIKNDAKFIRASVESCINALDELIIVYNDCTDNSPQIIAEVQSNYPDKVKVYEYKEKIYSINLSREEYEFAKSLPDNSPHLLCNYYNFALSKVTYQYALKIDADQLYFTEKLEELCNLYRNNKRLFSISVFLGYFIWAYTRLINRLNINRSKIIKAIPKQNGKVIWRMYMNYVMYMIAKTKRPISLSGIDVFKDDEWYVTLGLKNEIINILPPYNGVGDHMIFKVGKDTYYRRDECDFYNSLRTDSYTLIEQFVHEQGSAYNVGLCWFHLNAMRDNVKDRVKAAKFKYVDYFLPLKLFIQKDFNKELYPMIDKQMMVNYQASMFQLIHQLSAFEICNYIKQLYKFNFN